MRGVGCYFRDIIFCIYIFFIPRISSTYFCYNIVNQQIKSTAILYMGIGNEGGI